MQISIELYNETTDEYVEIFIECKIWVEPTEYEGDYVFYQGGVSLDDYQFEAFTFMGIDYSASRTFPSELTQYVVGVDEKTSLDDIIINTFNKSTSDITVPTKYYPANY